MTFTATRQRLSLRVNPCKRRYEFFVKALMLLIMISIQMSLNGIKEYLKDLPGAGQG